MRQRWLLGLELALAAFVLVSCSGGTDAAKQGVTAFRDRVTHRSFAEIYRTATPEFRQAVTEEQFQRLMAGLQRKLGTWQSSKEPVWHVTRSTGGHFVSLTYESEFSKGPATEQFTWRIEQGAPVLLGYNVRSSLLVMD
ncbi:MAG TPA: DUF4019 domain-containing protein [Methylomirabilota bacterium]|nr:DUF4019 domain-containing protein [Methylomirabilota bacterium]